MMLSPFRDALILTGPTASGKSSLGIEQAERLNAEIIAVDSMTLYREMDVGTAKPTPAERARVAHHLVDVLDPSESASVAWWLERATACVRDIENRGKRALFVGGTPFYLKALLCGLFAAPPADEQLRQDLEAEAQERGPAQLHARLAAIDPVSAARLHPNDVRRVVRALEVWQLTGRPLSAWQQQEWWADEGPRFAAGACLAIDMPRPELYDRINKRVTGMFAAGWVDEVRRLRARSAGVSREASQALGYPEIGRHLDGQATLEETIALVQLRTRQYAKRQLTWFRSLPGLEFCTPKLTLERWPARMAGDSAGS